MVTGQWSPIVFSVILHIFGVVLFSVFSVVKPEFYRNYNDTMRIILE